MVVAASAVGVVEVLEGVGGAVGLLEVRQFVFAHHEVAFRRGEVLEGDNAVAQVEVEGEGVHPVALHEVFAVGIEATVGHEGGDVLRYRLVGLHVEYRRLVEAIEGDEDGDDEAEERREEVRDATAQPPDEVREDAEGQEDEQAVPKAEGRGADGFDVGPCLFGMPPAYPRFGNQPQANDHEDKE